MVLGKNICTKNSPYSTMEVYDEADIFIPADITQDVVNRLHRKYLGVQAPELWTWKLYRGGFLKFKEDSKKLCTSVEIFVDWVANKSPPWEAYC